MSRLSEILGVEEEQEFQYESEMLKVVENKIYRFNANEGWRKLTSIYFLERIIAFPEKIKIVPKELQLTKKQKTAIKGRIAEGTPWAAISEGANGIVIFFESKPVLNDSGDLWVEPTGGLVHITTGKVQMFDFIKSGECVYLPDLIGDEEE